VATTRSQVLERPFRALAVERSYRGHERQELLWFYAMSRNSLNESCAMIDGLIDVTQCDVTQYYIVERGTLTTSSRSS
jgi:hypothetical protein